MSTFLDSLKNHILEIKMTRWVRFIVVSAVFFLWVILMGNAWLSFLWLILRDIYILNIIPWGWWKKKK